MKNFSVERHLRAFVIESVTLGYVLVLSQAWAHFGALTSIITHSLTDTLTQVLLPGIFDAHKVGARSDCVAMKARPVAQGWLWARTRGYGVRLGTRGGPTREGGWAGREELRGSVVGGISPSRAARAGKAERPLAERAKPSGQSRAASRAPRSL